MKITNMYIKYLNDIGRLFSKAIRAIVSGIPSHNLNSKPGNNSKVFISSEEIKPDYEKHYHKPYSKTAVEQQTLRKEMKKTNGAQK